MRMKYKTKWRDPKNSKARALYMKKYVEENKEKIKKLQKKWYIKNKDKSLKNSRKYYYDNREKCLEQQKEYHLQESKNPLVVEKWKARSKKYRENNRDKVREYFSAYRQKESYKKIQRRLARVDRVKHPKQHLARRLARKIKIPNGQLCQICKNKLAVERHHEDYDKPLEIKFLCMLCHKRCHN